MAAGSILIDLLLKTGSFESDTKRAEKRLAELKKEAQAMGVAVGAAFAAVGAASVALVKSSIDAMDSMSKLAQKTGTTVEALSALAYAADLSGVSQDQLGAAMVKLSRNMSEAASGSEQAAKGFDALGLSVTNADGSLKTSDQLLGELADKFASMPDGVDKTAAAVGVFGRAGADLIPLLNGGSEGLAAMRDEAQQLGVVLDTETSKAAELFNDNLSRMGAAVSGVANRAAGELLPALNDVSSMLVDVAKNEGTVSVVTDVVKAAVGGLITVFQTVAVVGSDVGFVFMSVGREIGAWAAQIAALGRGDLSGFTAISDAVKADGERARAELDKFQARVMAIGQPGAVVPMSHDDFRRGERAGRGGSRSPARVPAAPPRSGRTTSGRIPAVGRNRADKEFAVSDRWSDESAAAAEAEIMNEAQQAWASYAQTVAKAEKPLADVAVQMSEMDRMALQMGDSFGSALEHLIIGGGNASDVVKGLLQDMAQMILKVGVLEPMMAQLRQSMGGGGGTPPNPFAAGSGGGIDWGGIIGSFFGGFRAEGGPVEAGKAYVVGERGPEWFAPNTAGTIVPNHAFGGARPVTIVQNMTVGDVASMKQVQDQLRASEARIATGIDRAQRYGRG